MSIAPAAREFATLEDRMDRISAAVPAIAGALNDVPETMP
jgi:hypothetical protein